MLCSRRCYNSGHEDTSRSLTHVTVCISEQEIVCFSSKGSRRRSYHWQSNHCPRCHTLHISLFFAGLVLILCNVGLTIYKLVLSWVGVCAALYGFIPILRRRFWTLKITYGKWLVQGMQKIFKENTLNSSSEVDTRTFTWTFDTLDEYHELERFFSSVPDFRRSKVVHDPLSISPKRKNRGPLKR